jgi:aspartate/methionine/tyrosine aminotransferase
MTTPAGGFTPPPYPYDQLVSIRELAEQHEGGVVDLSIGTPCDPPSDAVVEALGHSGAERGYPPSVGTQRFRQAATGWIQRRFGVTIGTDQLAACVGTKEFVASVAWYLHLRNPERDTVLYPAVSYPTYAMGATLARCRAVPVPATPDGGLDIAAISPEDAGRALLVWVNTPANPSGTLTDLAAVAAWGRAKRVPVLSDECYAEFTWSRWPPPTILQEGTENVLALHSLSKRSNLAGVRVGCYAGDRELVSYLSEVRKHAGLLVPGPVQAAAAVAFDDDAHVFAQRDRYWARLTTLGEVFEKAGLEAPLPAGGFYLWVPVPRWGSALGLERGRSAAWVLTEALAAVGGVLVSPGDLYGEDGEGFVRVAVVQPDDRLELVAQRLRSAGPGALEAAARRITSSG